MEACSKASLWQASLQLLSSAQHAKLTPDVVMVSAGIDACDAGRNWQGAVHFLELMKAWAVRPNPITYTNLLSACGSCGQWPVALALISTMTSPNTVSCGAGISSLGSQWQVAIQLMKWMQGLHVQQNTATYNSLIKVCGAGGALEVGLNLLDDMRAEKVLPNALTFTSLMSAVGSSQEWMRAMDLAKLMQSSKVSINLITRNSLINALSQGSAWQTALTILVQTLSSCQATDSASFHAVIRAADVASKWPLALVVLAEMPKRHIEGCLVCCSSAMRACRSEWQVVMALLASVFSLQLLPDATAYTAAVTACGQASHWQAALDIFAGIPNKDVNAITYSALTGALSTAGVWELVSASVRDMIARDIRSFSESKYDHTVQAGSSLDCFKHSILVMFLQDFCANADPLLFVDTHAGRGLYDLSVEGRTSTNYELGIGKLLALKAEAQMFPALDQYICTVRRSFSSSSEAFYPGSAALAASWLRPQDLAMSLDHS
ncbi:Pentatricopeptide repeat-containing protein At2g31400 [Durusdinium trenchii]|uniref:Chloroplastic n=1 Tax=Durusdinium trenchii TaxID=1381693 RepID=A0ABP0IFC6_9DINO